MAWTIFELQPTVRLESVDGGSKIRLPNSSTHTREPDCLSCSGILQLLIFDAVGLQAEGGRTDWLDWMFGEGYSLKGYTICAFRGGNVLEFLSGGLDKHINLQTIKMVMRRVLATYMYIRYLCIISFQEVTSSYHNCLRQSGPFEEFVEVQKAVPRQTCHLRAASFYKLPWKVQRRVAENKEVQYSRGVIGNYMLSFAFCAEA